MSDKMRSGIVILAKSWLALMGDPVAISEQAGYQGA